MIELDTIYNEDCLVGMRKIPDGSIDAIICDLPYGVLGKGNIHTKWDIVIPFEPLWEQYKRVIKDNAAIILFSQGMFTADLMQSNRSWWRYNIIWDKLWPTGFLNARRMPLRRHEDICVFYKSLPTYNPQMTPSEPHYRNHGKGGANRCYNEYANTQPVIADEKFPTSIVCFTKGRDDGNVIHPTQKPLELVRYLVRTYTNKGNVVLDNCIGSGTTAIACLKERRHFIGFELNKEYYEKACKRIKEEKQQLTLF